MQHTQTPAFHLEGHTAVWRTVMYLTFAVAGLVAAFEHSPGLLVALVIAFLMVLALTERVSRLNSRSPVNPPASTARLLGDGGSFPSAAPEKEHKGTSAPMPDGGSSSSLFSLRARK